jgi:hypothetical protein
LKKAASKELKISLIFVKQKKIQKTFQKTFGLRNKFLSLHPLLEGILPGAERKGVL